MSVGPRFVFTRFASRSIPRFAQWTDHLARVTGVRPAVLGGPETDDDTVVVWSLVSGNNRELARGWRAYSRFDVAAEATAASALASSSWEQQLVSDAQAGGYGWYLAADGVPEAVCARWYESDRDRRAALRGAIEAIVVAVAMPGARAAAAGLPGVLA